MIPSNIVRNCTEIYFCCSRVFVEHTRNVAALREEGAYFNIPNNLECFVHILKGTSFLSTYPTTLWKTIENHLQRGLIASTKLRTELTSFTDELLKRESRKSHCNPRNSPDRGSCLLTEIDCVELWASALPPGDYR